MAEFEGNNGPNEIIGTDEADLIRGLGGQDTLFGEGGDDSLEGGDRNDTLFGGEGNDALHGGLGVDAYFGGAGDDILDSTGVEQGAIDEYSGGDGYDTAIVGLSVTYRRLILDAAASVEAVQFLYDLNGTNRNDRIDLSGVIDLVDSAFVNLNEGADVFLGSADNDSARGGDGDDELHGNAGDDYLIGDFGRDTLFGGAGDDEFGVRGDEQASQDHYFGGDGVDTFFEGAGTSYRRLILDDASSIEILNFFLELNGTNRNDRIDLSGVTEVVAADWVLLHAGADVFLGSAAGDRVGGGDGNDSLVGNDGNDYLAGDAGRDTLYGGNGNDTIEARGDEDEAEAYFGGSGRDTMLFEGAAFQQLILNARASIEILEFGPVGSDVYGTAAQDIFDLSGVTRYVNRGQFWLGSNGDRFAGSSVADVVYGERGNDSLRGAAGNDLLDGGTFDDVLEGGAGDDVLVGGGGGDTFVFDAFSDRDRIDDFGFGRDRLDLSAFGMDEISLIGSAQFGASGAAEMREVVRSNGRLFQLDADGDGSVDLQIASLSETSLERFHLIL